MANSREVAWERLLEWSLNTDDHDMNDEAREWAEHEGTLTPPPANVGEWKASLEVTFEAGRRYERLRGGR